MFVGRIRAQQKVLSKLTDLYHPQGFLVLRPLGIFFISAIVARSTVRDSTVIILKGVVNFLLNRILLSQVHARARKHTDTHKLACKSSLVRIRYPLSWENIWPHILFLRFAPPDHQLLTMFVYVFTHCSTLMNRYMTYVLVAVRLSGIFKGKQKLGVTLNSYKQDVIDFTKISKISKMTMCRASVSNS